MGRQRPPLPVQFPFEYVVLGQPHSAQNKTAAYTAWRERAFAAVAEEVDARTGGRNFVPSTALTRILIVWLSAQPNSTDHPDVSNIVKPLEDALVTSVIDNDKQIRRLETALTDLNRIGMNLPDHVKAAQNQPAYASGEVVYIRIDTLETPDGPEWEWWK